MSALTIAWMPASVVMHTADEGEQPMELLTRRDWTLAALLALAFGLLYALTFQTRTFLDGHALVSAHVLHGPRNYPYALYLPLCDVVQRVLGLRDPFLVLHLVSFVGGGIGLGAGSLVLRLCGATRFAALVAVGLAGLSPALWFFATTVHTLALLYGMVACLALLTLLAPWQRPWLALLLVAAGFPLLLIAHLSFFVLGPAWVLLVQFARARHGSRFTWPELLFAVGPLLLAALGAGEVLSFWMRSGSLNSFTSGLRQYLLFHEVVASGSMPSPPAWREEWLLPQGVLVPLAAAGFLRLKRVPDLALAASAGIAVPIAFFLWFGGFENGGYFLGSQLFLLVPVAFLFRRFTRTRAALALVFLAAQGVCARARIEAYDTGWDPAARAQQVRAAIGESGLLLSTCDLAPDIRCYLPGVQESSLTLSVRNACKRERTLVPPERMLAQMKPFLDRLLEHAPHVCVELGYPAVTPVDAPHTAALAPQLRALEGYLREVYAVRDLPDACWPMMVLERRR